MPSIMGRYAPNSRDTKSCPLNRLPLVLNGKNFGDFRSNLCLFLRGKPWSLIGWDRGDREVRRLVGKERQTNYSSLVQMLFGD